MSDKINDGGPAFPQFTQDPWQRPIVTGGMSLRDYFAGQAMAGLLAHPQCQMVGPCFEETTQQAAIEAYAIADAMLAARKEAPRE